MKAFRLYAIYCGLLLVFAHAEADFGFQAYIREVEDCRKSYDIPCYQPSHDLPGPASDLARSILGCTFRPMDTSSPPPLFSACWDGTDWERDELASAFRQDLQRFPFPEGNPLEWCRRLGLPENSPQVFYNFQIIPGTDVQASDIEFYFGLQEIFRAISAQLQGKRFVALKFYGARVSKDYDQTGPGLLRRSLPHKFLLRDTMAREEEEITLNLRENPSRLFALQIVLPPGVSPGEPQNFSSILCFFYAVNTEHRIPGTGEHLLPQANKDRTFFPILGERLGEFLAAHHSGKPAILWPLGHRHLQSALTLRSPEEGEAFPAPDPTALLPYYREQANGETDGQEIQPLFTKCLFCHHEGALPGDRGAAKELCGPYFNVDALPEELFQFLSTPSLFGKIRLYANIQTPCTDTDNPKPFKVCLIRPHDTVLGQSRDTVEMKARYAMKLFGASFEDARDDERGSDENHAGFTGNRSDILSNFYLKTVWNHYIQKRLPDGTRVQSMAYSPDNCRVNGTKEDKNWVFWSVVLGRCLDAQGHWETQNTAIVTLHISLSMDDGEHLQWDDDMVEAKRNFDHGCSSHFDLADAFYRKFQELHPGMTDEANPLTVFRQLLNPAGI